MEIAFLLDPGMETVLHERTLSDSALSDSAYDARTAMMLLDLLDCLRHEPIGLRVYASFLLDRELWLQYRSPNNASCMITITLDHLDYGPLVDGLLVFHYRMTCQITDSFKNRNRIVLEDRTRSVESAVEFVRNAIRETRILP